MRKNYFPLRMAEHWKKAAQWRYGVFFSGDIHNSPGSVSLLFALGDPTFVGGLDKIISRDPF